MRVPLLLALVSVSIVGCAREQMSVPVSKLPPRASVYSIPQTSAPALAFTPPVAREMVYDMDLDRTGRGTFASAGYESQVVSETYVRQDDRMRLDHFGDDGYFERRAISTTVTVRQR